jgi:type I restriction enzyme S subunit
MSFKKRKLADITNYLKRGITPKYVDDEGFIVLNQKCIRDNVVSYELSRLTSKMKNISEEKFLQNGDVLVNSTGTGTLGRTARFQGNEQSVVVDSHITIVRPDKNLVNDGYLGYYLASIEYVIENMARGATNQVELSAKDLGELLIPSPDLKTQERIASTLSAYDDLIENNRRRIQLLEESARLLYREWFVHFRFPGHEHVEIVDGLPQGWKEVKFEDTSLKFIDGDRGKNYPNHSEFRHNGYCLFLSAKNVTSDDKFNFSNELMFITKEKDSILRSGKLKRGDLVLTTRGTVGNVAYYDDSINFENIRINSGMVILRDFEDDFESYYLYVTLRSLSFKDQMKNFTSGTAQPQLPIRDLKKMKILKPSSKIMKNYCVVLKSSSLQIQNLELQNQKLKEARDILLPRLMNGEIAV